LLPLFCNETDEGHRPSISEERSILTQLIRNGAKMDHTLVWVHRPAKYGEANTYASYGNEPSVDTIYVAAAVIVDIPAFGTTRRNGVFP